MTDPGLTDLIAAHLTELIADAPAPNHEEDNYDAGYVAALADLRDSAAFKLVVEQHTKGRHEWPKTTPTGFTYELPTTYAALEHMIAHMAQSEIECWNEAERPPEPVWEMVGVAQQEVQRLIVRVAELEAERDVPSRLVIADLRRALAVQDAALATAQATIARVEALKGDLFLRGGNLIAQWGAARLIGAALEGEQQ